MRLLKQILRLFRNLKCFAAKRHLISCPTTQTHTLYRLPRFPLFKNTYTLKKNMLQTTNPNDCTCACAPKPQIRLLEKSIIQIIRGPQLKTRRNRNFPHIQSLSHGKVRSEKSAPKSPFCVWLTRRFGGSCHVGIQLIVHALKVRNPIV